MIYSLTYDSNYRIHIRLLGDFIPFNLCYICINGLISILIVYSDIPLASVKRMGRGFIIYSLKRNETTNFWPILIV